MIYDLWPAEEFIRQHPLPDYIGPGEPTYDAIEDAIKKAPRDISGGFDAVDGVWTTNGIRIRKSATSKSPAGRWVTIPDGFMITTRKNPHAVALGRKGGKAGKGKTSPTKASAARLNGRRGGRPKKAR